MAAKSLEERVDMLERRVEILEQLPGRITALEVQIVHLRHDMRAEFSAIRSEVRAGGDRVVQTLREEIGVGNERVVQTLRKEMRDGDEETRRFMRILYEDLVARIEILGGKR
jgi:hypothetical protein